MLLTIDLMYALVMTSVTGTLVALAWYWVGKLLERLGFLNILYDLLRMTMLFWFVPVVYFLEIYFGRVRKLWQEIFVLSPMILKVSVIFCTVWGVGAVFHMVWYLWQLIYARIRVRAAIECENSVSQMYAQICEEYGIRARRVHVMRSCWEKVPKVVGVLRPKVLLSMKEYSSEELRVIFCHELIHIKKRDLLTKNLGMILRGLHFWNPAAWWYVRLLNKWSEFACDYRVCTAGRDLKNYYGTILDMAEREEALGLFSQLVENKSELRERMEHVMRCYKRKSNRRTRTAAAVIVGCMMLVSTETVYAAMKLSAYAMVTWSRVTEVAEEEAPQPPMQLKEYEEEAGFDTRVVEGEVNRSTKGSKYYFNWDVGAGETCQSPWISKQQGESIFVSVGMDPDDKTVRVGIVKPNGTKTYVMGADVVTHTFSVSQTGSYRVYIENRNSVSVSAGGYYK